MDTFSIGSDNPDIVIIIAGQSNGVSRPYVSSDAVSSNWRVYVGRELESFNNLYHPTVSEPAAHSSAFIQFADKLSASEGKTVRIYNYCVGGSSAKEWYHGHQYSLISAVRELKPDYIFWVHGETDSRLGMRGDLYYNYVSKVIDNVRGICPVRWYICLNTNGNRDIEIRSAQRKLIDDNFGIEGPDLDLIREPENMYDGLHFNSRGLKLHSEAWFRIFSNN